MGKRFHPPSRQRSVSHVASGTEISVKNITVCPHPPYSPDLAPCDFRLFPKVKMTMKGNRFQSIQDIEAATTAPTEDTHETGLPELLQKMARTMG